MNEVAELSTSAHNTGPPELGSVLQKLQTVGTNGDVAHTSPTQSQPDSAPPEIMEREKLLPPTYDRTHKSWKQTDVTGTEQLATLDNRLKAYDPEAYSEIPKKMQREHALAVLEMQGFLRKGENGEVICTLDKFRQDIHYSKRLEKLLGPITVGELGRRTIVETFVEIFRDQDVFSEEDYIRKKRGEEVEPQKLFYQPENDDVAFDIDKIKSSKSYLGLWHLGGQNGASRSVSKVYPTLQEGNETRLSGHEVSIASLIYHPKYGNGYRDSNGNLIVTFTDGEERKISNNFFVDWKYYGASNDRRMSISHSPYRYVLDYCPNLISNNLLKPEDFRVVFDSELMAMRDISSQGRVTLDKIGYYLDRKYRGEDIKVLRINSNIAAIIDTSKTGNKLKGVFRLTPPSQEEKERKIQNRDYNSVRIIGVNDVEYIFQSESESYEEMINYLMTRPRNEQKTLISVLVNMNDYTEIVNAFMNVSQDKSLSNKLVEQAVYWGRKLRGLEDGLSFHNIQTFYGTFEKGKVDMNEVAKESLNRASQIEMIKKYIPTEEGALVVEGACGLAPLTFALANDPEIKRKKVQFSGYDLAEDNIIAAHEFAQKEGFSEVQVEKGDWHKTPYQEESIDFEHFLGRSLHHLNNEEDANSFFAERARVIKDGGVLMFDALDPTTGLYRENRLNLIGKLEELGKNFKRYGQRARQQDYIEEFPYTVDAPWGNDKDFFNRYTPSIVKWKQLAEQYGFELVEFIREPIFPHDITREDHGGKNSNEMNCTFVLRKKSRAEQPSTLNHTPLSLSEQ